jgi:NADH:ubiquinone oxidoreductase subunit F (NADH-binding)/NADH:ubiquinone oxidoreductase subunit E
MIVQRLRDIQNRFGYLPDEELKKLAREADVPLYRVEEVASFFPAFRQERHRPKGLEVYVCRDYTCHLRGAGEMLAAGGLPALATQLFELTGRPVKVEGVSCLGRCDRAPALWVEQHPLKEGKHALVYAGRSRQQIETIIKSLVDRDTPAHDTDADYATLTNTDVKYIPVFPVRAAGRGGPQPDHPTPPAAAWEINAYGKDGTPPTYAAVRKFAQFLEQRDSMREPFDDPPRLSGDDLDRYVEEHHPLLWELCSKRAALLGMGGAGAPTYQKWLDVWQQPSVERDKDGKPVKDKDGKPIRLEKYIVCNGDESEPGTFKDRELLLRLPHLVVEGVILAGLMTNATAGYIYIRHEYHEQIEACRHEIERANRLGACGENIFGSGRSFPVEVFESPGGYICGEQSALIEAMEDRRSQPRNRPPELTANGLRDKPTVVNNVETLAWAPYIVLRGGSEYAAGGWRTNFQGKSVGFGGRRLFSISGDVNRPGVYEVPNGIPLGDVLNDPRYCGGVKGGKLKAVATSGPSGGLLPALIPVKVPADPGEYEKWMTAAIGKQRTPADREVMAWFLVTHLPAGSAHLDLRAVPMDLNFYRNIHGVLRLPVEPMLGAGLAVYAEGADVLDHALNYTRFYRNESCGKCVPCRIGSQKLVEIGTELLSKRDRGELTAVGPKSEVEGVRADVTELTRTLQQTSICGLGFVAPIPLATALAYFEADVRKKPKA